MTLNDDVVLWFFLFLLSHRKRDADVPAGRNKCAQNEWRQRRKLDWLNSISDRTETNILWCWWPGKRIRDPLQLIRISKKNKNNKRAQGENGMTQLLVLL